MCSTLPAIDFYTLHMHEQIEQYLSQNPNSPTSKDDALSKVLGPDHSGRVCSLGIGGLHSVAFGSTTRRFSGIGCNFSRTDSTEASQLKEEVTSLKAQLATSEKKVETVKNVLLAYIKMKEGHMPTELGSLMGTASPVDDELRNDDEWGENLRTP